MKLKRLRAGEVDKFLLHFAVDMDLPNDGAQRQEFIASIGLYPWQAHASVNFVFAQETAAVIDVDLRLGFECIS